MKYKMGALVTEATGKIGGMVAMGGKSSSGVLRVKSFYKPKENRTSRTNRFRHGSVILGWQLLSSSNKDCWYNSVFEGLTGFSLFMHINLIAISYGSLILKPPLFIKPVSMLFVSAVFTSAPLSLTIILGSVVPAGCRLSVFASKPLSQGCSVTTPNFVRIGTFTSGSSSAKVFTTALTTAFKVPFNVGDKVFFKLRTIRSSSGLTNDFYFGSVILT